MVQEVSAWRQGRIHPLPVAYCQLGMQVASPLLVLLPRLPCKRVPVHFSMARSCSQGASVLKNKGSYLFGDANILTITAQGLLCIPVN